MATACQVFFRRFNPTVAIAIVHWVVEEPLTTENNSSVIDDVYHNTRILNYHPAVRCTYGKPLALSILPSAPLYEIDFSLSQTTY